jgi:hypothetical protein
VTDWPNFRPMGNCLLWAVFWIIAEVAKTFLGSFVPRSGLCINFDKKMDWATFWAAFSQTHLVTLFASDWEWLRWKTLTSRVTGCVCEKSRPRCGSTSPFLVKINSRWPWKKVAQLLVILLSFSQKNYPKKTVTQLAKIHPIWGRCYDHNFLRFSTIFCKKLAFFLKNQCYDQNFA